MYDYKRFQDLDRSELEAMFDYKLCYVEKKDNSYCSGYNHVPMYRLSNYVN